MTPQERLDHLRESVWVPTNRMVTIGMIREDIGLTSEQYRLVRGSLDHAIATLKASDDPVTRQDGIDLQDALTAMLSGGTSLSRLDRQATIDRLAAFGQWPDDVRDAVKSLGGATVPRWQNEGYESEPTLTEIEREFSRDATLHAYRNSHSAHIVPVLDGDTPTIANLAAAFRAAADELESQ